MKKPAVQILLLRGVNVGGKQMVAMADLRAWLARTGWSDVQTLLQSGNVVARTPAPAVVRGSTAYLYYPDGIGDSKLTPAVLDRTLGVRGTARNWNTVLKIAALALSMVE